MKWYIRNYLKFHVIWSVPFVFMLFAILSEELQRHELFYALGLWSLIIIIVNAIVAAGSWKR